MTRQRCCRSMVVIFKLLLTRKEINKRDKVCHQHGCTVDIHGVSRTVGVILHSSAAPRCASAVVFL